MKVIYRLKKDNNQNVRLRIQRSISYYSKNHNIKVGITSKPKRRASKYASETIYDEMIVLFKTSSERVIRGLEKYIVDKNRDSLDNVINGGGGPLGEGPYYLYVVTSRKSNIVNAVSKVALIAVAAIFGLSFLSSKSN